MTDPLVDVTGARRRRARARVRRRLVIAAVVAGLVAVVLGAVWVFRASPWFAVQEVRVEGNALATPDQVVAAAAVPSGASMATLDTGAIEARILDQVPAVAAVRAARDWPSTLTITVTERTPRLVLELPEAWVWVSAEGVSFHTSPERPPGVVVARGNLGEGDILATLAVVAGDLPPQVSAEADHIEASSVDSVTIVLNDKRRIIWGSAEDGAAKAGVIVPLLKVGAKEYDVSAPNHPTTR